MPLGISTVSTPSASDTGFNAPNFSIRISGAEIPLGVRQLVTKVEYESADGMADVLKVTAINPDFVPPKGVSIIGATQSGSTGGDGVLQLSETKIFQPGNEIDVAMGYGAQILHIGRAIIRKTQLIFPQKGTPSIDVIAYTKDSAMMDNAPEKSKKQKGKGGRIFKNMRFSDAVKERATDYDFALDVDDTPGVAKEFIQKVGLSDYDFVRGLANMTGFTFWVDGDADGTWTLHFKDPAHLNDNSELWPKEDDNPRKFKFKYNDGQFSTLLSFEPELAIQGAFTKLKAGVKDVRTGKIILVEFEEDNTDSPDVSTEISGDAIMVVDQALDKPFNVAASSVKLFIEDFSINVKANRQLDSESDLREWARQWFRRNRENFVLARGMTIGVEQLRARQIHGIAGVGRSLSGDYQFTRVRHIAENKGGYTCEFNANKRVPEFGG
jgi:phage protein D